MNRFGKSIINAFIVVIAVGVIVIYGGMLRLLGLRWARIRRRR